MKELYLKYLQIGGYPAVVNKYLTTFNLESAMDELEKIINVVILETTRYFKDIAVKSVFEDLLQSVAKQISFEKKGLTKNGISEELTDIAFKGGSSNISTQMIRSALGWLESCHLLGYCHKVIDCDTNNVKKWQRCYFRDVGIANYYLKTIKMSSGERLGILNETFVYNCLRQINKDKKLFYENPAAFATLQEGEIDFFCTVKKTGRTYAINIGLGESSVTTAKEALAKGKVDKLLYLKGDTYGGVNEDVITVPIYGLLKFDFDSIPEESFSNNHTTKHIQAF